MPPLPPTVTFTCGSDDQGRIEPIVNEVKKILNKIGFYNQAAGLTKEARELNNQFVKRLREKLKILNNENYEKGVKDTVQWTPCEFIGISNAEHMPLCSIMPR